MKKHLSRLAWLVPMLIAQRTTHLKTDLAAGPLTATFARQQLQTFRLLPLP